MHIGTSSIAYHSFQQIKIRFYEGLGVNSLSERGTRVAREIRRKFYVSYENKSFFVNKVRKELEHYMVALKKLVVKKRNG